jgi:hypothetical protein
MRLLLSVALLALLEANAGAGDYHAGETLRCAECHIMHYSQGHAYGPGGFVGSVPLGGQGPYRSLLRNRINDLCLACHDGNVMAADVLGAVNSGSQAGIVRNSGYLTSLLIGVETGSGHSLESLDEAPGSQPSWTAQMENGFGEGLSCINCHQHHGAIETMHPTGSQFRNLRDDVGSGSDLWVTYNHESPGVNDLTRDVFLRGSLSYDEAQLDWNEPDPTRSAIARWCVGCHTNMHQGGMGGGGGGLNEHPFEDENLEGSMLTRYNSLTNRVKVMSEVGTWFPAGGDTTPTCITCHRAHGNGNRGGLIFRSGTGVPTEDGDTGGNAQGDLCRQCHGSGSPMTTVP